MTEDILKSIEKEFVQLNYHWKIYCQLYDSGEHNIELLNKSGSNVFHTLQYLIIENIIQNLCRLDDPPKSVGKKYNASIHGYLDKIELTELKIDEVNKLLLVLEIIMKNIRITRNKSLSHNDLLHATNIESLPRITYIEIESAIFIINKILNNLTGNSGDYIPRIPSGHDAIKLLKLLNIAHEK